MSKLRTLGAVCGGLWIAITTSLPAYADHAGSGCYAKGYLTYDRAFSDPNGLYFVFFGTKLGLSNPVKVTLPFSPMNSGSIECRDDIVRIALRGKITTANGETAFDIYYVDISTSNPPTIIRSAKNHVERWKAGGTKKVLESVSASSAPVRLLPQATFRFGGVGDGRDVFLPLRSDDALHDFIFEKRLKKVMEGNCPNFHIEESIVRKSKDGRVLDRVVLDTSKRNECGM